MVIVSLLVTNTSTITLISELNNTVTMAKTNTPIINSENNIQVMKYAQNDMRIAYLNGSCGLLVSGLIWLTAGCVAIYFSPQRALWTLLIGGVFIHPTTILLNKILGASGTHRKDNPLAGLALEGTIWMIISMSLAYLLSFQKLEWFFQSMLLIISGRYLTFASLYGIRLYWVVGAVLAIAAFILFVSNSPSFISALTGSAIEIIFGLILLVSARKTTLQ
jgi:hypothetical protein